MEFRVVNSQTNGILQRPLLLNSICLGHYLERDGVRQKLSHDLADGRSLYKSESLWETSSVLDKLGRCSVLPIAKPRMRALVVSTPSAVKITH